ncbi:NADPH:quinone oxidoreductase [Marinilactibacillus sp. 15R]|uniref:Putative NAD(P)H quinone oxidoreductase, PIG3 family n=1 Tax=Marinilactibacillus piezotolerans TaxID=258723 RepID=A0A1I3XJA7_9LACT|nr:MULTISPECIES: NAD(P)H-quinone oxidoreductase [Marinilactibacillus]API88246.1 NADPH:quinone oxidoreductase [Marinilactibacillus sp. 15R]SFK19664.1 putative NAD(P)H quinone oxidoreductase, PIG3 family [Marinilactibacillus piezotolerans]
MRAWTIKEPGSREQLIIENREKPEPKDGEILIKVKAASINRTDTVTRQNPSLATPYPILGVEVSGVVVENHSSESKLNPGAKVAGLVNHGGYAEYVTMPADRAILFHDSLTMEEAAAIPEVFLTAYQTLYWLGELKPKQRVLIHAAGSGVGTAAIQLARHLSDAFIFATAGHNNKLSVAKELGADHTINYKKDSFDEIVNSVTDNKGVDVILDFVGASYWDKNLSSCALDARWVLIGALGGTVVEKVSLMKLIQKRVSLKGTLLTPRSDEYKAELTKEFIDNVMPLIEEGKIKPIIHSVLPFEEAKEAHRQMEDNENTGKIILKVSD